MSQVLILTVVRHKETLSIHLIQMHKSPTKTPTHITYHTQWHKSREEWTRRTRLWILFIYMYICVTFTFTLQLQCITKFHSNYSQINDIHIQQINKQLILTLNWQQSTLCCVFCCLNEWMMKLQEPTPRVHVLSKEWSTPSTRMKNV